MYHHYREMIFEIYEYLGISPCTFRFKKLPSKGGYHLMGNCIPGLRRIEISKYGSDELKITSIAHELRHQWQFDRRVLVLRLGSYEWLNKKYFLQEGDNYNFMPHEVDAILFSHHWLKLWAGKDWEGPFSKGLVNLADKQLTENPRRVIILPQEKERKSW